MAKGSKCPTCSSQTFHDKGSVSVCSNKNCQVIGWSFNSEVKNTGKGQGCLCKHCSNQTLHDVLSLPNGLMIQRCSTCSYTIITPTLS